MRKLLKHSALGAVATYASTSAGIAALGTAVNASVIVAPLAVAYVMTHDKDEIKVLKRKGKNLFRKIAKSR
ncbi:hypothetical protein [Endozoicomonas arenosclerae]|uniref:hypothetical protein n=1 Tax=Endozoicomonas arenosclerae TaxID=1633495 RepID=UPI000ABE184C|nr:hypothetical protein [Endozoicomonas arenosclerae]